MTNNLERRVHEYKHKMLDGFSKKYNLMKLVYFEHSHQVDDAIAREKQLKSYRREKKDTLIENFNPEWLDLSDIENLEKIPHYVRNDKVGIEAAHA